MKTMILFLITFVFAGASQASHIKLNIVKESSGFFFKGKKQNIEAASYIGHNAKPLSRFLWELANDDTKKDKPLREQRVEKVNRVAHFVSGCNRVLEIDRKIQRLDRNSSRSNRINIFVNAGKITRLRQEKSNILALNKDLAVCPEGKIQSFYIVDETGNGHTLKATEYDAEDHYNQEIDLTILNNDKARASSQTTGKANDQEDIGHFLEQLEETNQGDVTSNY